MSYATIKKKKKKGDIAILVIPYAMDLDDRGMYNNRLNN